jgi:hypothetical protein
MKVPAGFGALGGTRAGEAMRGNTEGWSIRPGNLAAHVAGTA